VEAEVPLTLQLKILEYLVVLEEEHYTNVDVFQEARETHLLLIPHKEIMEELLQLLQVQVIIMLVVEVELQQ
tara:strand:+ start:464 stop:679 length:216 start_codon:yes stop_codon:yes gene_type:complete